MLYSFGTNPVHDSTCVCSTKLILLIGISLITWIINGKENVVRTNELKLNVRENSNGLKNHATHAQKGREWYQKKKKKKKVKTTVSLLLISFKRHLSCWSAFSSLSPTRVFSLSLSLSLSLSGFFYLPLQSPYLFYLRPSFLLLLGRVKSMIQRRSFSCLLYVLGMLLLYSASLVCGGDIVHHDDSIPQRPGCNNNFVLVRNLSRISFV